MQITLKQSDIEQALKAHIANLGVNLVGKTVGMTFTAGRKAAGISVELNIDDTDTPSLGERLNNVTQIVPATEVLTPTVQAVEESPFAPVEEAGDAANDTDVAPAPADSKVSLFGN